MNPGDLSVCINFKSPFAYLAMAPTYALEDELGIEIDWRPLIVAPMTEPRAIANDASRGARHRHYRRQYVANDVLRYADARGLALRNIFRAPDSTIAAIGLLFCGPEPRENRRRYMDLVFERYWKESLDIEDSSSISGVLSEAGVDPGDFGRFVAGEGRAELGRAQQDVLESGIQNAPAYLLGDEVFIGRQHLPMIRWLLSGRQGAPPI